MNRTKYGNIAVGDPDSLARYRSDVEFLAEERLELLRLLCRIAYPRRGTKEEEKTIYDYAHEIQTLFSEKGIDYHDL